MALSERERQMLEEMEEAIRAEDPRFASQMNGTRGHMGANRKKIVVGVVGALVGLGLVLLGVNTSIWVGVAGFVIIVAAVAYAATPGHTGLKVVAEDGSIQRPSGHGPRAKGASRTPKGRSRKTPNHGSFMQRMEQRWEERRRQGY